MGIMFIGVGVVFLTSIHIGLGIALIAIGTSNIIFGGISKKKWPKK